LKSTRETKALLRKNIRYKMKQNIFPQSIPKYLWDTIDTQLDIQDFSIVRNPHISVGYFSDVVSFMQNTRKEDAFFALQINLDNIQNIGIECIMYFIALVRYKIHTAIYRFDYFLPKSKECRNYILSTGLSDYSRCYDIPIKTSQETDCFKIVSGDTVDATTAGQIIDFLNACIGREDHSASFVYAVLIELMGNTKEHAYYNKHMGFYLPQWYIFAENTKETINITFLDIGEGIPSTMRSYCAEVSSIMSNEKEDVVVLSNDHSTLLTYVMKYGNLVSRKDVTHRGHGLPQIYELFVEHACFQNLTIVSGKGYLRYEDKMNPKKIELKKHLHGTLFYWEIKKSLA